jgi:hypothetical protein
VNVRAAFTAVEPGFTGAPQVLAQIQPGANIAYFGNYDQVFAPFVRERDTNRQTYLLRGKRILESNPALTDALYRYRVRYLLMDEAVEPQQAAMIEELAKTGELTQVSDARYTADGRARRILIFRNAGPVAPQMPAVPLGRNGKEVVKGLF